METLGLCRITPPRRADRPRDAALCRLDPNFLVHRSRCRAAPRTCCTAAYSTPPEGSDGVILFT